MGSKTKKIKASGRYRSGYGTNIRNRLNQIESLQRKKQVCPHCGKPSAKRQAVGIWHCSKCDKTFAGHAYILNRQT